MVSFMSRTQARTLSDSFDMSSRNLYQCAEHCSLYNRSRNNHESRIALNSGALPQDRSHGFCLTEIGPWLPTRMSRLNRLFQHG